jgi:site-specific DNA recombinase
MFSLYTRRRGGSRAVGTELNARGYCTSTGRTWSGHHVIRILSNRVYLGELTFRGNTVTGTHTPISH